MKLSSSWFFLGGVSVAFFRGVMCAQGQGAPDIEWEAPTASGLANSIQGVAWSPASPAQTAFGSTDRWLRTRDAATGALIYSVLQPHRSGSANQTVYSTDGAFLAVHNSSAGLGYRIHRETDGVFLGMLNVNVDANGLVHFAADAQLLAAVGGDGSLSRWQLADFTVSVTVGSGYDRTNTTFNFSPSGLLQSSASQGRIEIRQRGDGAIVRVLTGGQLEGSTPLAFTADNTRVAAWNSNPNRVTLWRISDGAPLMNFAGGSTNEGVTAIRFTFDGSHLVTTGYLPYLDRDGLWQQKGMIRFWRVDDGVLRKVYDARTGIGITSPIAWAPDGAHFAYGTYEGTAVVARTPVEIPTQATPVGNSLAVLSNGDVRLRQAGTPGTTYHVEATTNFLNWQEVGVTTPNASGFFEFTDTNAHGVLRKFYRAWKAE